MGNPSNANSKAGLAPGFYVDWSSGQPVLKGPDGQTFEDGTVWEYGTQMGKPYPKQTTAPPGTYDPALDAQGENAALGLTWAGQDYGLGRERLTNDYNLGKARLGEDRDFSLSGLLLGKNRGLEDIGTSRSRLNEDWDIATKDLGRQFSELADSQTANARAAGVAGGGALAQSLMKRQADQSREQGRLDLGRDRGLFDLGRSETRLGEDYDRNVGRTNTLYDRQGVDLDTGYARGTADMDTLYGRQQVQGGMFQNQLNSQKIFQAQQGNMLPGKPVEVHNGIRYERQPDGRLTPIGKAR